MNGNATKIHITAPLSTIQKGPKALIKKIIRKTPSGYDNNIKRNMFNKMIRKEYSEKSPIFDLAEIESTYKDGTREVFYKEKRKYFSLVPAYTDDGDHLNEFGRRIVAEQLLIFLANLCE